MLARIARKAGIDFLRTGSVVSPQGLSSELSQRCGVFVSIRKSKGDSGRLATICSRGYLFPTKTLIEATVDAAVSAVICANSKNHDDLRNPEDITFEVSVVSGLELVQADKPIDYPKRIEIGFHGLHIESGFKKAVILPSIPVEEGWNEVEFISECCMKAGLRADAWLLGDVRVYKFKTETFTGDCAEPVR